MNKKIVLQRKKILFEKFKKICYNIYRKLRKELKVMGISCKPTGKMKGLFQKIDNERAKEQQILNRSKRKEKSEDKES